jgi:YVTN family beta-propeller protein
MSCSGFGKTVYVANLNDNTIFVIDTATTSNSVTNIATKFYPNGNPSGALGQDVQMALWVDTMNNGHNFITDDI